MTSKRILATALCALIPLSALFAAGGAEASSASAPAAAEKPVTLHIIHWKTLGQNVIDAFQKENPGIVIQYEQFPVDRFIQVIKTRIAANELPDILGAQEVDFPNYVKEGVYLDLSSEPFYDNYYEGALAELKAFTPDGKLYTLPTDAFMLGFWINKSLFEKNGVKIPTNYDEVVAAAAALKAKGVVPFVQGARDGWPLQQDMMSLFRLQLRRPDFYEKVKTGEAKWTDPDFVDALAIWKKDFADNLLPNSLGVTYSQAFELFNQQKAAMWPMGSWATEFLKNSDGSPRKFDFDLGFIPLYANKAGEKLVAPGTQIGAMWAISAKSKNIEAAKKFFAFISKPANAAEFMKNGGTIMPIKGVDHGAIVPGANLTTAVMEKIAIARPFNMTCDAAIESKLTAVLQELILGTMTSESAAAALQKVQETANRERK